MIRLREVRRADIDVFFAHEHDPRASRLAGVKPRARDEFMAHWDRILADETVIERTILADGAVAGRIACFEMQGRQEIGYWIGREFWGMGVTTGALGLFLAEIDRRPLFAQVSDGNAASIRVLTRHGFTFIDSTDEAETDRYLAGRVNSYQLG